MGFYTEGYEGTDGCYYLGKSNNCPMRPLEFLLMVMLPSTYLEFKILLLAAEAFSESVAPWESLV